MSSPKATGMTMAVLFHAQFEVHYAVSRLEFTNLADFKRQTCKALQAIAKLLFYLSYAERSDSFRKRTHYQGWLWDIFILPMALLG